MAQVFAGRDALAFHNGGDSYGPPAAATAQLGTLGANPLTVGVNGAFTSILVDNLSVPAGMVGINTASPLDARLDITADAGEDGIHLDLTGVVDEFCRFKRLGATKIDWFTNPIAGLFESVQTMYDTAGGATLQLRSQSTSFISGAPDGTADLLLGAVAQIGGSSFEVQGDGTTSATESMEVYDSAGALYFKLRNDGRMGVGAGIAGLAATFVCTGQARAVDFSATLPGTPGDPAYSFTQAGNTDTGMYSGGVDELNFSTAGAERVTITPAGLLGINQAIPGSTLTVEGSQAVGVTNVTAGTTTLDDTHYAIFADCTAGTCVVRLPTTATPANRDRVYVIKKVDASANPVNVQTPVGIALDGVVGITPLTVQYQSMTVCAGTNADWFII
jgi:hypothetical protein